MIKAKARGWKRHPTPSWFVRNPSYKWFRNILLVDLCPLMHLPFRDESRKNRVDAVDRQLITKASSHIESQIYADTGHSLIVVCQTPCSRFLNLFAFDVSTSPKGATSPPLSIPLNRSQLPFNRCLCVSIDSYAPFASEEQL